MISYVRAGALAATLAACDVDMDLALERALALCEETGALERGAWGLYGIWGGVIRQWLDELLPEDAAQRCDGRVELLVTTLNPGHLWLGLGLGTLTLKNSSSS